MVLRRRGARRCPSGSDAAKRRLPGAAGAALAEAGARAPVAGARRVRPAPRAALRARLPAVVLPTVRDRRRRDRRASPAATGGGGPISHLFFPAAGAGARDPAAGGVSARLPRGAGVLDGERRALFRLPDPARLPPHGAGRHAARDPPTLRYAALRPAQRARRAADGDRRRGAPRGARRRLGASLAPDGRCLRHLDAAARRLGLAHRTALPGGPAGRLCARRRGGSRDAGCDGTKRDSSKRCAGSTGSGRASPNSQPSSGSCGSACSAPSRAKPPRSPATWI